MQFYTTDSKSIFLLSIRNSVLLKLIHLAANNNKNDKKSTKFQKMKCWMCQNKKFAEYDLLAIKILLTFTTTFILYKQIKWNLSLLMISHQYY